MIGGTLINSTHPTHLSGRKLALPQDTLYNQSMSQKRLLSQLQDMDTQLDQARSRLKEIDAALNDNSTVKRATRQAEKAEERFIKARLALKKAEQAVQVQQQKIDKNQKALYGGSVRNPKELEDLQMESGALRRYLSTLEDRQLEEMILFEEAQAAKEQADANLISVMTEQEKTARNILLGPYAQQMVNHSPIPVLCIHPKEMLVSLAR